MRETPSNHRQEGRPTDMAVCCDLRIHSRRQPLSDLSGGFYSRALPSHGRGRGSRPSSPTQTRRSEPFSTVRNRERLSILAPQWREKSCAPKMARSRRRCRRFSAGLIRAGRRRFSRPRRPRRRRRSRRVESRLTRRCPDSGFAADRDCPDPSGASRGWTMEGGSDSSSEPDAARLRNRFGADRSPLGSSVRAKPPTPDRR